MVTIVVSVKPTMPEVLFHNIYRFLSRETEILINEGGHSVTTVMETGDAGLPRKAPHAIRAKLLQTHRDRVVSLYVPECNWTDEDYVVFVDADIVNGTVGVLNELVRSAMHLGRYSVVAPTVLLEHPVQMFRWYDTAGFIHDGQRACLQPPWFPLSAYASSGLTLPEGQNWKWQEDSLLFLNGSVGCVYCVHGPVFGRGGFRGSFDTAYTEHFPLCQNAQRAGGRIAVRLDLRVDHAFLPKYGEEFH